MRAKQLVLILITMISVMASFSVMASKCADGVRSSIHCCNVLNSSAKNIYGSLSALVDAYNWGAGERENPAYGECHDEINVITKTVDVTETLQLLDNKVDSHLVIAGNNASLNNKMSDPLAPLFEINGARNVEINSMVIKGKAGNPFVKCTDGYGITLKNIIFQNKPGQAIVIEGCSSVTLETITILGTTTPDNSAIIQIIPPEGESLEDITIKGVIFSDDPTGNGIEISHATGVSVTEVEANNLKGTVIKLNDITNLKNLGITGNNVNAGVYLNDVFGSVGTDGAPAIDLDLTGNPAAEGDGLFLDQNIRSMKFQDLIVQNFGGNGIVVKDASNENQFIDITVYQNNGYGIAFYDDSRGNKISGSSFVANGNCGIYLGSTQPNMLVGRDNQIANNGADCAVGGVGLMLSADAVKLMPASKNEVLVDFSRTLLEGDKWLDLHYFTSKISGTDLSEGDATSFINQFDTAALPIKQTVSSVEENYLAIIKDSNDHVLGIWTGKVGAATGGNYVADPNCYVDPNTSEIKRLYDYDSPIDSDGDGLKDHEEDVNLDCQVQPTETDPYKADTDGDLLDDYFEKQWGTSPTNVDDDKDGLNDGVEDANNNGTLDPGESSPKLADTDGDGMSDKTEKSLGTNPQDSDSDDDEYKDGADDCPTIPGDEFCYYKYCVKDYVPTMPIDWDLDGLNDYYEDANNNCQFDAGETRPDLKDTDGDLIPDGVEDYNKNGVLDEGESSPVKTDTDGDCIPDGKEDKNADGSFDVENGETDPTVADSDGDGLTDGAEDNSPTGKCNGTVDPGETKPYLADTDGDTVNDNTDICPWEINQKCVVRYCGINGYDNYDADADGLADVEEDTNGDCAHTPAERESNPLDFDTDDDGLNDSLEVDCFDTNPIEPDTDGDGKSDYEEVKNSINQCQVMYNKNDTNPKWAEYGGCGLVTTQGASRSNSGFLYLLAVMSVVLGFFVQAQRKGQSN
ncbi:MAG: hypothetical protein HQM16_11730 [Deltaproteobacteria bacterium]|nr:hypothetical protein [Deltaproteobacteria bacterium]